MEPFRSDSRSVQSKSESAAIREKSHAVGDETKGPGKDSAMSSSTPVDKERRETLCKEVEKEMSDVNFRIDKHPIWEIMNSTEQKTFGDLFKKRKWPLTEKEKEKYKEWENEFNRHWARLCMELNPS